MRSGEEHPHFTRLELTDQIAEWHRSRSLIKVWRDDFEAHPIQPASGNMSEKIGKGRSTIKEVRMENAFTRPFGALLRPPQEALNSSKRGVAIRRFFSNSSFKPFQEADEIIAQPREVTFGDFL